MIQIWKVFVLLPLFALPSSIWPAQSPHVYRLSGDVAGTHDPSIIKEGNTWYVFATGKAPRGGQFAVRCSDDLEHWKLCGHVFDAIPAWILERSPGTKDLWAPDISYAHHEYRLYYAYSLFGKNTSGIALAINKTLDPTSPRFKWLDKGLVLESKTEDNFNAIDPTLSSMTREEDGSSLVASGMASRCADSTMQVCYRRRTAQSTPLRDGRDLRKRRLPFRVSRRTGRRLKRLSLCVTVATSISLRRGTYAAAA
jgi:hypothetical protein